MINSIQAIVLAIGSSNLKSANLSKPKYFKRTYNHFEVNKNANIVKKEDDIEITFEDFTNHFEIGKQRIVSVTSGSVSMDIGKISSGVKETWVLPNLSSVNGYKAFTVEQESAIGTKLYNIAEYGTHHLSSTSSNTKELYDLTTGDLFFIGYSTIEDGDFVAYQYDQTKAPIPIKIGLEFKSIVKLEDDDNSSNYVQYTDTYYVIGQGTLQTFDDGDAEAMKMIYREEEKEFENNIEISHRERYKLVFYSKKGHYVTAEITDPWNSEDTVNLENMIYQKLAGKTASVNDELLTDITIFPNPIATGATLTIDSKISLKNHIVDIYNTNGQKVSSLPFAEKNSNQYETTISNNLAEGIYFYKIHDKKGSFIKNGKLLIK
ncbi:hypothetical protein BTO18_14250 [Polaribacter porphyrae]|uniref:Secretion system C-terminal sorting domain-containing protein n=2 Tax=Polaribacter porphyrae TaxID=1137780 RepID=A0A2S7WRP9_9FLAO|nr:hypothetical protein BTO18_14250 [Polaribacter porphyrae]